MKAWLFLFLLPVAFVGCGDKESENVYTGILEGKSIQVPALTGGKIERLMVETGQSLEQGDTIALIDTTELSLQLRQLQAGLDELEVQAEISQTNLRRAQNDLDYMKQRHERMKRLVNNNSMPAQNLDDLTNQLEKTESEGQAVFQTLQSLKARRRQIEAQVQTKRKKINDAVILAPAAGIIASKYYEEGEAIPPLSPIVESIQLQSMDVKIYVSVKRLPEIKYNQEVTVRADGLDRPLKGNVRWISPKSEFTPKAILTPETRSSLVYAVKITIPNPEGVLKHGMPIEVVL